MKKTLSLIIAVLTLFTLAAGCAPKGGTDEDKGSVSVYNWGLYIDKDVLKAFEDKTGIKVNYDEYPSNEMLYSNLQTRTYDVIIPSDYMIIKLIEEGMLEKINFDNVPNYSLLADAYKNLGHDPTGEYSVPYMWGTVGIIYDPAVVSGEPDSWSLLWDEQYADDILQFDNPRDAAATALFYLGYSVNTADEAQIREAFDLLAQQKSIVQKHVMDQIYTLMESGEAAIGPYYAGDYLMMLENNPDLRFFVPKEGTNMFVDSMCIPKGAKNKENAEAFINFMCETEVCVANMNMTGYASPNPAANDAFKEEYDLDDPEDLYQYNIIFPSDDLLSKCEVFGKLPKAAEDLYSKLWIDLFK